MCRETGLFLLQTSSSHPWRGGPSATTAREPSPLQGTSTSRAASASQGKGLTCVSRQARQFGYSAHLLCHPQRGLELNIGERKSPQGDPRNSFALSASYPGSDFSHCVWMSHPIEGSGMNKMSDIWPIKVRFCFHIPFTEGHFPSCSEWNMFFKQPQQVQESFSGTLLIEKIY